MAVNPNYTAINAEEQMADPASVFHYYRRLLELRRRTPALIRGDYLDIDPEHASVFAYTRTLGEVRLLVVIHFGREQLDYTLPNRLSIKETLIDSVASTTAAKRSTQLVLAPWQAAIFTLA